MNGTVRSAAARALAAWMVLAAAARAQVPTPPPAAPPANPGAEKVAPENGANDAAVDALLDRWQKQVVALHSFTARFRQEKKVAFMRRPLVSSGHLKYRDRKLLWVTDEPAPSFLSFDGKEARIYHPDFNTLEIYALGAGMPGAAAPAAGSNQFMKGGFPGFTGDFGALRQLYRVEFLTPPAAADGAAKDAGKEAGKGAAADVRLRFTPKGDELKKDVQAIEFLLDPAFVVKEWKLVRANGDELRLLLSDFVADAKVEDADLRFDVPAGVKVVELGGGGGH